jgi:hypothetical protein
LSRDLRETEQEVVRLWGQSYSGFEYGLQYPSLRHSPLDLRGPEIINTVLCSCPAPISHKGNKRNGTMADTEDILFARALPKRLHTLPHSPPGVGYPNSSGETDGDLGGGTAKRSPDE